MTALLTLMSHSSTPPVEKDMASTHAGKRLYLRTKMQLGQGEQLEGKGALALLVCLQHLKLQQSW